MVMSGMSSEALEKHLRSKQNFSPAMLAVLRAKTDFMIPVGAPG